MLTCPQCGSEMAEGAHFCEKCGYRFGGEADETKVASTGPSSSQQPSPKPQPTRRPWYKRKGVVITLILVALLLLSSCVGVGIWLALSRQDSGDYENQVKEIWEEVIDESNQLKESLDQLSTQDDLKELSSTNSELVDLLKDKQNEVDKLEPPTEREDVQKEMEKFLEAYIDYLTRAQRVIDNSLEASSEDDFVDLEGLSNKALSADEDFVEKADFVDGDVPEEVFDMPDVLRSLAKKIQTKEQAEEKAKKEKQLKEQIAADNDAVEDTVISFMQAYINAQAATCRKYLTSKANDQFDPTKEFNVNYSRLDFKVTSLKRISSTSYNVYGTEYDRDQGGNDFTTRWRFEVIKTGGKWLIDNRQTLS